MYESLGKAAAAAGVSKSTILRAIKSHRISAGKTETGDWQIDPAELHRVFPPVPAERAGIDTLERGATPLERDGTAALEAQITGLREIAELLRHQLEDVRSDRDAWRDQASRLSLPAPRPQEPAPATPATTWWRWLRSTG
jgi:hypothetical protein